MPLGQDDNHTKIPPTLVIRNCTGWVLACQVLHLGETDNQYNGVARTLARGKNQSKGVDTYSHACALSSDMGNTKSKWSVPSLNQGGKQTCCSLWLL